MEKAEGDREMEKGKRMQWKLNNGYVAVTEMEVREGSIYMVRVEGLI